MERTIELLTDETLINYLQSGNLRLQNRAFRFVYKQYYGLIESFILNNSGSKEQVADIFQDGIIVFFNQAKHKDFEIKSSIKTYLYAVCKNLWLMYLRKTKKEVDIKDEHKHILLSENYFDTLVITERKQLILKLINGLGTQCQKLLKLFYYQKMRMAQIKEEMHFSSEQVAKNKKSICMKSLRLKVMENEQYQISLR